MSAFIALLKRDITTAWRSGADSAVSLIFALLVVCLFPFALDPDPTLLRRYAPGLLLVALLLSQFMALDRLFRSDHENGTLDLIMQSGISLPLYVLAKGIGYWLTSSLPLLIISPLLLLLLQVEPSGMLPILLAMLFASLILALLGLAGSALTLGSRQPALLLPLLLVPFAIPVLIFAVSFAGTSEAAAQSGYFLGGLFFLYLALSPFIAAGALKAAQENT